MRSLKALPVIFFVVIFVVACTGKGDNSGSSAGTADDGQEYAAYPWPALARLKTGENPIWFEFGEDGPGVIESPSAASLTPYLPWPHARYVTAMTVWNGLIVMVVNRDGFLVLGPAGDLSQSEAAELILYRCAAAGSWDPYTAESFFFWEDKPAVLLYRNDFFGEVTAPPPQPPVYTLDLSSAVPVGAHVPALETFPSDGSWETELLHRGPDGLWYYRMKEKGQALPRTAYFHTGDLNVEGVRASFGEWMSSASKSRQEAGGEADENKPDFSLPSLGEGFVYTNTAVIGNVVAASWEEQQEAGIGAAGFMVMNFTIP